eukprot:5785433-Lingulodinium_polyedra.AAC.1
MSASVVAKGNSNIAHTYWFEPTPAPAPAPPAYVYPIYQPAPVPTAGSQWDHGASWTADSQWVEPWPTYESVVTDAVHFAGGSDADTDTNTSEDSGRETLDF